MNLLFFRLQQVGPDALHHTQKGSLGRIGNKGENSIFQVVVDGFEDDGGEQETQFFPLLVDIPV